MLARFTSSPGVGALLVAVALTSLSLLPLGADGRVRLEASVLEQSRGSGLGNSASDKVCNTLNNITPCTTGNIGETCMSCARPSYFALDDETLGGYIQMSTATDCGFLLMGICDSHLICSNTIVQTDKCSAPDVPSEQAEPGGISMGD